jgi:hypothetical protein
MSDTLTVTITDTVVTTPPSDTLAPPPSDTLAPPPSDTTPAPPSDTTTTVPDTYGGQTLTNTITDIADTTSVTDNPSTQTTIGPNTSVDTSTQSPGTVTSTATAPTTGDTGGTTGDTGGGTTGVGTCPAPWINITLADGSLIKAGDIKPGMMVYTRHETTGEWGNFAVTHASVHEDTRWIVSFEDGKEFVGTFNHRVLTDRDWVEIDHLQPGDKIVQPEGFAVVKSARYFDIGTVVKITVESAHTYLTEGFVSHNIKGLDTGGTTGDTGGTTGTTGTSIGGGTE